MLALLIVNDQSLNRLHPFEDKSLSVNSFFQFQKKTVNIFKATS